MSYTPTTWSTGDTITASALNKIEQGIAGSGGYDLVIASNIPVIEGQQTISNWSIIEGSIETCEEKLENGQPINAMAIVWDQQWSTDPPNDIRYYLPLIEYYGPYSILSFGGIFNNTSPSGTFSNSPCYVHASFRYNASTKVLTYGHYGHVELATA